MPITHPPLADLPKHCASLAQLLHLLAYQRPITAKWGDETFGWLQPADWLELASSVVKVEVLTAQGDESLWMCGSALDYEDDRSALLSQLTTTLTVFSFAWGAFESVAKIANPPIPKEKRTDGNDALTARIAYSLGAIQPDGSYYCCLSQMRHWLGQHEEYRDCLPRAPVPVVESDAGQGIDLVRRIRNRFAHGAARLPQRDDWSGENSVDNRIVRLSCRMVLLTIQMVLRVVFYGQTFVVEDYGSSFSDCDEQQEIHSLLQSLQFVVEESDDPDG